METGIFSEQRVHLIAEMRHWLELFDGELAEFEVTLPDRPFRALLMLFRNGAIEVGAGDQVVDLSNPGAHARTEWFRILYDAIRAWYIDRYGREAMRPRGIAPLEGMVMIRGTPFRLAVEASRRKVQEEGKTAWFYLEERVHSTESALSWIKDGPKLDTLPDEAREALVAEACEVADALRLVEFRRIAASVRDDEEARKLVAATSTYLQQAARRILSGNERERGPAWFDLQMAVESALKASIRHASGEQPYTHQIVALVERAREHGVQINDKWIAAWPDFRLLSEWRYGQGKPWNMIWFHRAYVSALRIARACMAVVPIRLQPGFGVLLEYPPWQRGFE